MQIDKIEKYLSEIGIQNGQAVIQDRDEWKQICVAVMSPNDL